MKCWPSGPAVEKRLALALAILSAASCLLVFDGIRSLARTNNERARVLEDFRQAIARMRNGDVVDVDTEQCREWCGLFDYDLTLLEDARGPMLALRDRNPK